MKPFVRGNRDEAKILAAALIGGAVAMTGEVVTELAYLPLYLVIAVELVWQRMQRPRGKKAKARSA